MSQLTSPDKGSDRYDVHKFVKRLGVSVALLVLIAMISAASAQNEVNVDQTWWMSSNNTGLPNQDHYWMSRYIESSKCNTVTIPTNQSGGWMLFIAKDYYGNGTFLPDDWLINISIQTGGKGNLSATVGVWNNATESFIGYGSGEWDPNNETGVVHTNTSFTLGVNEWLAINFTALGQAAFGIKPCESWVKNTKATIGDWVWDDCTNYRYNGTQDGGEGGVYNVTVYLYYYNSNNPAECGTVPKVNYNLTQTNITDVNGTYLFEKLLPGCYYLEFNTTTTGNAWYWTLKDQPEPQTLPDDDALDSDVYPDNGTTDPFYILSGQIDLSRDAGVWQKPCKPIPELGTMVLFSVGLLTLAGYIVVRRRR